MPPAQAKCGSATSSTGRCSRIPPRVSVLDSSAEPTKCFFVEISLASSVCVRLLAATAAWMPRAVLGQAKPRQLPSAENGEWVHYASDIRGTRYMPLDQINAAQLQHARSGLALQHGKSRPAPGVQPPGHAADGQGHAVCDRRRRQSPRDCRDRCKDRRAAVEARPRRRGARRRRAAQAVGPRLVGTGPTAAATSASSTSRSGIASSR